MRVGQPKKSPAEFQLGFSSYKSLTMSYFHTGIRTIIGAKSFHCPVRDGKEWYQLAMVIRHNCFDKLFTGTIYRIHRANQLYLVIAHLIKDASFECVNLA